MKRAISNPATPDTGKIFSICLAHLLNDWYLNYLQTLLPFMVAMGLGVNVVELGTGVIPAKAGIPVLCGFLDPGFRRGDVSSTALGLNPDRHSRKANWRQVKTAC